MHRPLRVFLCHASQDKPAVRELYNALKAEGWIDPWLDKAKILPGQDWELVIEKAVDDSDVVIVCLSSLSVSKEGFVQREIRYAYDMALEKPEETIFLIPLRLDDCNVPRKLRTLHWMDFFGYGKENSFSDLLGALRIRYEQIMFLEAEELERGQIEEKMKREAKEKADLERRERAEREKRDREAKAKAERDARIKRRNEVVGKITSLISSNSRTFAIGSMILIGITIFAMNSILQRPTLLSSSNQKTATPTILLGTKTRMATSTSVSQIFTLTITPLSLTFTSTPLPAEITQRGAEMVLIPAGTFKMGEDVLGAFDEKPQHDVSLDTFYMDKYEVTNTLYRTCVNESSCSLPGDTAKYDNPKYADHPVVFVDWDQATTYCEWRDARLPTEAEWEYGASGTSFESPGSSNFNSGDTVPVGGYESGKSQFGLYDMAGNVWEWVNDWYSETYYQISPESNPTGPATGQYRVLRGGSWHYNPFDTRSQNRYANNPIVKLNTIGFRCAYSP